MATDDIVDATTTANLRQSLQNKLDELERRTQEFHRDMRAEFQRHCNSLLRDVAPDVVSSIQQDIDRRLPSFSFTGLVPELRSDLSGSATSAAADSRPPVPPETTTHLPDPAFQPQSQPQSTAAVFGIHEPLPDDVDGVPPDDETTLDRRHDRDSALHGVFTPEFLPFIDGACDLAAPAPAAPTATAAAPVAPQLKLEHSRGSDATQTTAMGRPSESSALPHGDSCRSPPPPTDQPQHETTSNSTTPTSPAPSDDSDSKAPRSALRHSSSVSRPPQSPRRVRFEFMGAEVLPTSSPQPSEFIAPRPVSPAFDADQVTSESILGGDSEEEQALPPRKISSSDALRALSRTPLEEGTVWTVVDPQPTAVEPSSSGIAASHSSSISSPRQVSHNSGMAEPEYPVPVERESQEESSENSSDEEFLDLAKPKSFANKPPIRSPDTRSPVQSATEMVVNTEPPDKDIDGDRAVLKASTVEEEGDDATGHKDEEGFFHFEGDGDKVSSAEPQSKPPPIPLEEESESDMEETSQNTNSNGLAVYATSPAIPISTVPAGDSQTPTRSKFHPGSLGSYKGRPVVMPVVRNPDVHARAASLGNFSSFVGSVHDDPNEVVEGGPRLNAGSLGFSGTPRSLTVRMMMEDALEERKHADRSHRG